MDDQPATDRPGLPSAAHRVTSEAGLEALYGTVAPRAVTKEIGRLNAPYRRFIEASPFAMLATVGPEGVDVTPRGDPAPRVRLVDDRTLMLPDRRGNNRLDSLRNIVRDGRVAMIFLVPGSGSTLRVNGRAEVTVDPAVLAGFEMQGKLPRSVIVLHVETVYFHCVKAFYRSALWAHESWPDKAGVPSPGEMLRAVEPEFDADGYDSGYPAHMAKTIY